MRTRKLKRTRNGNEYRCSIGETITGETIT